MSSGRYRYRLNGEIAPVEETWTLTGPAAGEQYVESIRIAGDVSLAVNAALVSGQVRHCSINWRSAVAPHVEASFEKTVTGVHWRRSVGEKPVRG